MKHYFFLLSILFYQTLLYAQKSDEVLLDVYHPKIAEFSVENIVNHTLSASSSEFGNSTSSINIDRLVKLKLGIPLLMKESYIMGLQLKYYDQQFSFRESERISYDLFNQLNDKSFVSTGIRTFFRKQVKEGQKFTWINGAELKSDRLEWNKNTTKYFTSATYKWRSSPTSAIGTGVVLNWTLGVFTFYPLFIYEKQLAPKWTLDLSLPKSAAIRWKMGKKSYLIAKSEFKAWRYNLNNPLEGGNSRYTLSKADVQSYLSWEREIHNWIWMGVDVGLNTNVRYFLINPGDRSNEAIIDLSPQQAPYFKISLFATPPKRFFK